MQQPTHRLDEGRLPVHRRVIDTITATLRTIWATIAPTPQMSYAGTAPTSTTVHRTDFDAGDAKTTTPLTAKIAGAMTRRRGTNGIGTTGIHAKTMHAGLQVNQRHDGTFGTGLDPSATPAVLQT